MRAETLAAAVGAIPHVNVLDRLDWVRGVILTHGNWTYEAQGVKALGVMVPSDSVMLFLPLAHSFAQVVKAAWLSMGFRMIFAESVDKLLGNLAETKPTVLPSVPRVFE